LRLKTARIRPLDDSELNADQAQALAPYRPNAVLNIFRTLANAPKAMTRFKEWGVYVLSRRNDLPFRQREIVILRTGFLCKSGYEWTQHVRVAKQCGLTDEEIERIKLPSSPAWDPPDAALVKATNELHDDHYITDATWSELRACFTEKQCMDVVFTAGHYTQVCMILNTFGVQLDEGQSLDPDLKGY
jgi:alkylhydroperoxidase family enzyme